jgi:DNA-binding response OmpR family regulator
MTKALLIEDDRKLAALLVEFLGQHGVLATNAVDSAQALQHLGSSRFDILLLDLMLPGMDGLEVCSELQRERWVPVLMLTARTEESDKIAGFAVGADDYLTKPFSLRELAVRVRAILRRFERIAAPPSEEMLDRDGMTIDAARRRVSVDEQELLLTPLEFDILVTLAREPGVVFTREQLMDRVWGYRDYAGGRVVDSHVARIRRKLREDGNERFIRTVHGVGYAFSEGAG